MQVTLNHTFTHNIFPILIKLMYKNVPDFQSGNMKRQVCGEALSSYLEIFGCKI